MNDTAHRTITRTLRLVRTTDSEGRRYDLEREDVDRLGALRWNDASHHRGESVTIPAAAWNAIAGALFQTPEPPEELDGAIIDSHRRAHRLDNPAEPSIDGAVLEVEPEPKAIDRAALQLRRLIANRQRRARSDSSAAHLAALMRIVEMLETEITKGADA